MLPHFTHRGHAAAARDDARSLASAGANVVARSRHATGEPGTISPAEASRLGFVPASVHQRGRFTAASGKPFGVYIATRRDTGYHCVIVVGGQGTGGACDPMLFSNGPVSFVEAASGGPEKAKRTDFELAGVVADAVARLDVVDSLGRVTTIKTVGPNKAFFFELKPSDLARGVDVTTLVARDNTGTAIASFDISQR
jgi:hypothetical protein